ncbi:hypothetical protein [Candidatus Oleimmundimicrobium sp.]|uniref:hypothetical protein n=1 Tax=Candidatus Oleimmundimicrobium sp. TaxID=3060597 RepID=UPI002715CB9A|nr:hypothetical protein [Candidatus Oleimmundimicrobium sp.]MDO8885467.1 hypothetical protein [Candidatus Oleimmundimicrobium sp.]
MISKSILASFLLCLLVTVGAYYERGISGAWGIVTGFAMATADFGVASYLIARCMKSEKNALSAVVLPGFLIRLPLVLGIIYYFIKVPRVDIYALIGSFIAVYSCLLFVELKLINDLAKSSKLEIGKG